MRIAGLALMQQAMAAEIRSLPSAVQSGRDPLQDAHLAGLLTRMASADVDALASFYDLTLSRVWGLVGRMLTDDQALDDVVAQVYEAAWRHASSYRAAQGPVLLWLLKIAREAALGTAGACAAGAVPAMAGRQAALESRDVAELLEVFDARAAESVALRLMPERQRSIVFLVLFQGMGWAQIASELRLPLALIAQEFDLALGYMRSLRLAGCGESRVSRLFQPQA